MELLNLKHIGGRVFYSGVLGGIRTHDLTIRNRTLYPAELQRQLIMQKALAF